MRVVLVSPKSPENVGAAARAMKNFGATRLVLVAPRCRLDDRAYALASHAGDVLDAARIVATTTEALEGVRVALGTTARERVGNHPVSTPRRGLAALPAEDGALVFGPEDTGLHNDDIERCQGLLRIPTAAYASLNLAQAVNVVLYERFQLEAEGAAPALDAAWEGLEPPAPRERVEAMYEHLRGLLHRIGFTDDHRERSAMHGFRRLIDRARPTDAEVALLRGLWRQAGWAAEQPPERLPVRPVDAPDGTGRSGRETG